MDNPSGLPTTPPAPHQSKQQDNVYTFFAHRRGFQLRNPSGRACAPRRQAKNAIHLYVFRSPARISATESFRQSLCAAPPSEKRYSFSLTGADFSYGILQAEPVRRAAKRKTLFIFAHRRGFQLRNPSGRACAPRRQAKNAIHLRFSLTGADFSYGILQAEPVRRAAKRKTLFIYTFFAHRRGFQLRNPSGRACAPRRQAKNAIHLYVFRSPARISATESFRQSLCAAPPSEKRYSFTFFAHRRGFQLRNPSGRACAPRRQAKNAIHFYSFPPSEKRYSFFRRS